MAGLGCLFVCTFCNDLKPILIAAHTVNLKMSVMKAKDHKLSASPDLKSIIKRVTCLKIRFDVSC